MQIESTTKPHFTSPAGKQTWLPMASMGLAVLATLAAITGNLRLVFLFMGLAIGIVLLFLPDVVTLLVLFILYSNLAVLGVRFHGLPAITAMLVPGLLLVPVFYHLVIRREPIIAPSSLPWMILFMAVLMISTILSRDFTTAFSELITYFTEGFLLYVLITNCIRNSKHLYWAIWVLLAAGIILGGVPLYQQITETFDNNYGGLAQMSDASFRTGQLSLQGAVRQPRLAGAVGEINRFAQVMLMLIPLALMRLWEERSLVLRALAGLASVITAIGMALPFSRGAALSFVLMLLSMVFFRIIKIKQLVVFTLIGALLLVVMPQYSARLVSIQSLSTLFSGETTASREESSPDGAILGRATVMLAAARVYADHPLFGVGPGMFQNYSREYSQDIGLRYIIENREAHNLFLGIAAESGTLGIFLFIGMLAVTIRDLFWVRKEGQGLRPDLENMATSFILVLIAYLSTGLFLHLSYMRYFWIVFALASSAAYIGKTEINQTLVLIGKGTPPGKKTAK